MTACWEGLPSNFCIISSNIGLLTEAVFKGFPLLYWTYDFPKKNEGQVANYRMGSTEIWASILRFLHDGESVGWDYNGKDAEQWADYLDEPESQVRFAINYLEQAELIEPDGKGGYLLTPRGFDVAHQRQMSRKESKIEQKRTKRQNDVNRAIGILTFGLLFATFADTALSIYLDSNFPPWTLTLGLGMEGLVIISVSFLLYKNELLSFNSN